MDTIPVGILGATGLVGQRLVERLVGHPWFRLVAVGASERSAGRPYREAVRWSLGSDVPEAAGDLQVRPCVPDALRDCALVLSALDAAAAGPIETAFVAAGIPVLSNSSAHRMQPHVPLLVPEVNAAHLDVLGGRTPLVTNPNCSVTGLALALAPLHRAFGIRRVVVATLQALSGAGLEGPRGTDVLDNVIPFIAGEEEKIETELGKILGHAGAGAIEPASLRVSAHCHRVSTLDGHLEAVSVELERPPVAEEAAEAMRSFRGDVAGLGLPSAPQRPLIVRAEPDRPQPRLDRLAGGGMSVTVGRVRPCPVLSLRFELLSHNTVRGAAGGALLNAELLHARGLVRHAAAERAGSTSGVPGR